MWIMLSVYTKTNFGLSERLYGWIPTTNALIVVFLQIYITQFTKRRPPLLMLALGALFYATALASVAVGRGFWWFWLCMVVMSIGELVIVPTATTFAANAAPADMRGRYMSLYGLAQGLAMGVAPILAGFLNDTISPVFIWYGAGIVGFMAVLTFLVLARRFPAPREVKPVTISSTS
jgi:MFS family permease